MSQELFDEIEKLKAGGMTAKAAFAAHGASTNTSPAKVQADYYSYRKGLKPVQPDTLSGQLRTLASQVGDLEDVVNQLKEVTNRVK